MLSQLLDVLDEKKDANTLDLLLDQNDDLFFNLILYYYSPKPSSREISRSHSTPSSASSTPPPTLSTLSTLPHVQPSNTDYTLQEKALCTKVSKFTAMHESHILDCYQQIKSTTIDTFAINEIQIWHYVFEERQRMFNSLISMLNYVINNTAETGHQRFADAISNHIHGLMNKGWRKNIVLSYKKLTFHGIPDHLPANLRGKYCEYIAEEQLLLWKLVFLLYYEPIRGELQDIDMYFELYPLSLKKNIQRYISNCLLPNMYESRSKIHEIMKKIDDLLIAVFMELLPIENVHGAVEHFAFYVTDKQKIQQIKIDLKLAQPHNLPKIQQKLEAALSKSDSTQPHNTSNNHLRNMWKIYKDIGRKLADFIELIDQFHATKAREVSENIRILPAQYCIYEEIEKINKQCKSDVIDAVTPANIINCFEKILITFGDCDDSKCFIQPMQCLIRSYLDAILLRDPEVIVGSDNIHYIYQHILADNHKLSHKFFHKNTLNRFSLWQYAWKSFQTQPYLVLGFLASLCSSKQTAQKVYEKWSDNIGYFTVKSHIAAFIQQTKHNPPQYMAKQTFEWNYIIIKKGTMGHIMTGRDKMTEIICWDTHWNGFLWLLSLLTSCINKPLTNIHDNPVSNISKHNIEYMSHNTLPSAMRLLTKLTSYYPEAIALINDDIKLVRDAVWRRTNYITDKKLYLSSHCPKAFKSIYNNGGIHLLSFQLFTHCMERLKEYDYASHSITNALQSTKDNYDWNLDLFKDATEFFKFMTQQSSDIIIKILYDFDSNDDGFFSKLIITGIQVLAQCIRNTQGYNQQCDELAFEKSQYQLKCVWNIIGYMIDIVNKIFIHRDIFYFQRWSLDIFGYVQTLFSIYPMFYPMTSFNVNTNDKTTLHSYCIELHYKASELVYNIVKSKTFSQFVVNKFCADQDDGFKDFIMDPIIYCQEILSFVRSQIRGTDERFVCKIITNCMKILQHILSNLDMKHRQDIMIQIAHKLNDPHRDAFEQISLADKLCQFMQQSKKNNNVIIVNECTKFLKFLCHIFPATSHFPYQNLFTSMTEIQRLSAWMSQYLHIGKWRKISDVRKACNLVDLLCIFMSNQNRLRHILLKQQPNRLLRLLFKIVKHPDAFNRYAHITAKCLEIFWLLHSDLDGTMQQFIVPVTEEDSLWKPIAYILSSNLQNLALLNELGGASSVYHTETEKSSFIMGKKLELEYINRCWQNECYCWCFNILLQEIEQTLSFFDEIDDKYMHRRKNINKLIHALTIEDKLLLKWMVIMVNIPGISVNLLQKRSNIAIDFRINLADFESDALRFYGDCKEYGRNCMDKYHKLINKLRLLSRSAQLAKAEQNRTKNNRRISGYKRSYFDADSIPNLSNVSYCIEVIEQFNLQSSLVVSHNMMLTAWSGLMRHICLCSPHIIGLLPITCYNNKLSQSHLQTTINKIKAMNKMNGKDNRSPSKQELNEEESIKQLFHWNILRALPKPKKQSKLSSHFTVKLTKMLNNAFKHMMDPQYFNAHLLHKRYDNMEVDDDDDKVEQKLPDIQYINLEGMSSCHDLDNHLSGYLSICQVLRDVVNHLTQDMEENEVDINNILTFNICSDIFINIAECIKIASEFAWNRRQTKFKTQELVVSPRKKRLYTAEPELSCIKIIDSIIELLLQVSMVIIKWMLDHGPKLDIAQDPQTSFLSSMKKKRPLFSKWKNIKNITTPIKKRLFQPENTNNAQDSDDDVVIDMPNVDNINNMNESQVLSQKNPWFPTIRGSLMMLSVLTLTSRHLLVGISIFPYLIESIPYSTLSLEAITANGFIKYCMDDFALMSNNIVELFIQKEKKLSNLKVEATGIMNKMFQTKSDAQRLIQLDAEKLLIAKEYIICIFLPKIEKLSLILQCFVGIAQESLSGAMLLFENELLLYLTNCSIFKSLHGQFLDPYLIDNQEENPCHELWCKSLELITYLLRQTALALNAKFVDEKTSKLMSIFIRNIMQFCCVHHNRILNKIQYIANTNSYLRLRDLEEINIISSFIYEIEKNSLLISQQSLNTNREFTLHKQRFYALLNVLSKFVIILESPEMLNSLTPPISTHEKYAFGHQISTQNTTVEDFESKDNEIILPLQQRQRSKHVHFSSSVYGGSNNYYKEPEATLSIHDEDSDDGSNSNKKQAHVSPLPLGKLLHEPIKTKTNNKAKSNSVETNIGDEEYDLQLRRDQFLQRIEYYILDILVSILFCCRYEILDNWNHRNEATYLFEPDLRQLHFLSSNRVNKGRPSLSVLVRLSHYCITHLKGLYQTQLNEKDDDIYDGILKRNTAFNLNKNKRDYMYNSNKVECEGIYHIVTWKNIEKTLWILFQHCYINLLLQIDCFMKSNEELVLKYIIQYRNCLDKLWKRITRFEEFLMAQQNENEYAVQEIKFITVLREKQHRQLIMNIEELRNKYMPGISMSIQRQNSDQTQLSLRSHEQTQSDSNTNYTMRMGMASSIYSPYGGGVSSRMGVSGGSSPYINTPRRHFRRAASSSSNVSSSWA